MKAILTNNYVVHEADESLTVHRRVDFLGNPLVIDEYSEIGIIRRRDAMTTLRSDDIDRLRQELEDLHTPRSDAVANLLRHRPVVTIEATTTTQEFAITVGRAPYTASIRSEKDRDELVITDRHGAMVFSACHNRAEPLSSMVLRGQSHGGVLNYLVMKSSAESSPQVYRFLRSVLQVDARIGM